MPKPPNWNCWSRGYTWPVSHISILPPNRAIHYLSPTIPSHGFPVAQSVKNVSAVQETACNEGDLGLIPGLGRSPTEENGNPLQYACPGNPMDRGA